MVKSFFIILILSVYLASCSKHSPKNNPIPPHKGAPGDKSPDPDKKGNTVCYPGTEEESPCLKTVELEKMLPGQEDFLYKLPTEQNGFPTHQNPSQYIPPTHMISLENLDSSLLLSPHFKLIELMSLRKGNLALFSTTVLKIIEDMRIALGDAMYITSAYRSPGYNSRIDGASRWSRHTYGDAIDFYSPNYELKDLEALCAQFGKSFSLKYTTHIHCDWRNHDLDQNFYPPSKSIQRPDAIAESIKKYTFINLDKSEKKLIITVDHPDLEDGGQLIYEWEIQSPSGYTQFEGTSQVEIPSEKGYYKIRVIIGGSISQEINFEN